MFVVLEGGVLTLDFLALQTQDEVPAELTIYVEGGALSLSSCLLTSARKFAVYLKRGRLDLRDCEITDSGPPSP